MAASTRRSSGPVLRSLSPCGRFYSPGTMPFSSTSSAFAASTPTFNPGYSATRVHRSDSPTRVNIRNQSSPSASSSVRFSLDRSISPNHSHSQYVQKSGRNTLPAQKRTCMCSPTTHPGSFRCSLHKGYGSQLIDNQSNIAPYNSNRLNMRRSAMTNSLVRIGTVEGDLVKRALAALIRPSSHQQRRRANFQARPSRLSIVSKT